MHSQELSVSAGSYIIAQDEPGGSIVILEDGTAEVLVGNERVGEVRTGDVFGVISFLLHRPRSASIRATAPCRIVKLKFTGEDEFFDFLVKDKPLLKTVLAHLARSLVQSDQYFGTELHYYKDGLFKCRDMMLKLQDVTENYDPILSELNDLLNRKIKSSLH